jgi:4-hydroxyphenylpyruvate dioxygenase-like putative hemolysin
VKNVSKSERYEVEEITQIGIVVKNLQKAMENYWETLGIGPWRIFTYQPPAFKEPTIRGKPMNYSMKIALAQIGSLQIELIEPLEGPSIYKEFLRQRGEGVHHIQSRPKDLSETLGSFKKSGVNVLMSGKFGEGAFYYMDSEPVLGIIIEVVERRGRKISPEAIYPPVS